jgi:hypothetical protein
MSTMDCSARSDALRTRMSGSPSMKRVTRSARASSDMRLEA